MKIRFHSCICNAGIRDVGRKNKNYRQRIDMTSPIPWWRQIQDTELLYDSAPVVYIGAKENADPSHLRMPILDDGHFYEDHADFSTELLASYRENNPDTLGNPKSLYGTTINKSRKDNLTLENYDKLRKRFTRAYKRTRYLSHLTTQEQTLKGKITASDSDLGEYNIDSEAMTAFLENYGPPTHLKVRKSFHETIGRELPHVKDDPRLLRFMPSDWDKQIQEEVPLERAEDAWINLNLTATSCKNLSSFDLSSITEKQYRSSRIYRAWQAWQEVGTAYNDYEGSIGRDVRLRERANYKAKFPMRDREQYTEHELMDAVMCFRSPTQGGHPNKILPWLVVKPPSPNFTLQKKLVIVALTKVWSG